MHLHGKVVSVWVDCDVTRETAETFCQVFDMGVDTYCTDYPLKVAQVWQNYRKLLEQVSSDSEKQKMMAKLKKTNFEALFQDTLSMSTSGCGSCGDDLSPASLMKKVLNLEVETL